MTTAGDEDTGFGPELESTVTGIGTFETPCPAVVARPSPVITTIGKTDGGAACEPPLPGRSADPCDVSCNFTGKLQPHCEG